jgi:hypothetical protein
MSDDTEDHIIIWEAPVLEKPEFRLYYDEKGYVVTYTCEKLDGNYVVIDTITYAEARPDIRVIDGKLVRSTVGAVISKLYPADSGILCEAEDLSIITDTNGQHWKLKTVSL